MPDDIEPRLYRGKWYAYWREGGETKRRSLGRRVRDEAEAKRACHDFERARAAAAVPQDPLVGDLVALYLTARANAAGYEADYYCWQRAKPTFAHLRPDQVDRTLCGAFAAEQQLRGVSVATVRKSLGVVRAALHRHYGRHKGPGNVVLPPAPPPKEGYVTKQDFPKLVEAAGSFHVGLFMILAVTTAARAGAILELTWSQVDFGTGMIDFGRAATKYKGRAVVPMNAACRAALLKAREAATTEYVIEYAGRPVGTVKKGFERAAEKAGMPWVTPHVLRHTAAVWMVQDLVPMSKIAQYLGHRDERVTAQVYARFSPEFLRDAAGALEVDVGALKVHSLPQITSRKSAK